MRTHPRSPMLPFINRPLRPKGESKMTTTTQSTQSGIVVSTTVTAGGWQLNHAEGVVVSTEVTAGGPGIVLQHSEGVVVSTPVTAGGWSLNHAEGVVVSTSLTAGGGPHLVFQHSEGVVVATAITAGPGSGGIWLNHCESLVG